MRKPYITTGSKELYLETCKYLVDGASSSFHKAPIEEYPICLEKGKGSRLYDVDGNEYIDYVCGFGPMILGYCPDAVGEAVKEQIDKASQLAAPTKDLCRLSKKLTEIIPSAEMVSYQSSGTEANMHAFRVARAYTGRRKIVKFAGHYHGWSDEQKVTINANTAEELGSYERPEKLLKTAGQLKTAGDDLIIMNWNDLDVLEELFIDEGEEIAAVITEPYMFDEGPIPPQKGYLEGLKELTAKYGIVLIFDEVITGFRVALGGAQEYFGVTPDMAVFGKAVAAGYSISLVCGKKEIMSCGVHPSGTFNATPIAVAASLATISELEKPGTYERFAELGGMLAAGLTELGRKYGKKLYATSCGAVCHLNMGIDKVPVLYKDYLQEADSDLYDKVYLKARDYGVRLTYARGRIYLSTAHTKADIEETLEIMEQVFLEI